VVEEALSRPLLPAPNVNFGSWFSLARGIMVEVERHLVLVKDGRFRLDFLRLWKVSKPCMKNESKTYSRTGPFSSVKGFGGAGEHGEIMSTLDAELRDGDWSLDD
jgi:hypothetical protein